MTDKILLHIYNLWNLSRKKSYRKFYIYAISYIYKNKKIFLHTLFIKNRIILKNNLLIKFLIYICITFILNYHKTYSFSIYIF